MTNRTLYSFMTSKQTYIWTSRVLRYEESQDWKLSIFEFYWDRISIITFHSWSNIHIKLLMNRPKNNSIKLLSSRICRHCPRSISSRLLSCCWWMFYLCCLCTYFIFVSGEVSEVTFFKASFKHKINRSPVSWGMGGDKKVLECSSSTW